MELTLKAGYCTRKGWADFPEDRDEAKRRGAKDVFTHELDSLLTLSNASSIKKSSLNHIDWDRIGKWDSEQRYETVGHVGREQAEGQILDARNLFLELANYEILEHLFPLEIELAKTKGAFNFFGLVKNFASPDKWRLVMSAGWVPKKEHITDARKLLDEIKKLVSDVLDSDLYAMIGEPLMYHPTEPLIRNFNGVFGIEHCLQALSSGNIYNGILLPPAYVITNIRR